MRDLTDAARVQAEGFTEFGDLRTGTTQLPDAIVARGPAMATVTTDSRQPDSAGDGPGGDAEFLFGIDVSASDCGDDETVDHDDSLSFGSVAGFGFSAGDVSLFRFDFSLSEPSAAFQRRAMSRTSRSRIDRPCWGQPDPSRKQALELAPASKIPQSTERFVSVEDRRPFGAVFSTRREQYLCSFGLA